VIDAIEEEEAIAVLGAAAAVVGDYDGGGSNAVSWLLILR
jgi:hypothetical protein